MTFPLLKKWMPVAKEKWATLKKNAEPYVQMVSEKSVEVYQTSSDFIRPHLVNAHQVADPYLQVLLQHLRIHSSSPGNPAKSPIYNHLVLRFSGSQEIIQTLYRSNCYSH